MAVMNLSKPVMPAPLGYTVDMEHPQRQLVAPTITLGIIGIVFSTLCFAMRTYTKVFISRVWEVEEVCILIAFILSLATQGLIFYEFTAGILGVHAWEISTRKFILSQRIVLASAVLYVPCQGFAKASLLLFYHRLWDERYFRIAVYCVMGIIIGYSISLICALIFPCNPIPKAWDITITEGSCVDQAGIYISVAALNIFTDVMVLALPIPMVWRLRMPNIQKCGVMVLFAFGSLTVITSIIRLVYVFPMLNSKDIPWKVTMPGLWICVEANLVIICGSLPALRQFLRHFAPRLIGEFSSRGKSDRQTPYNQRARSRQRFKTDSTYGRLYDMEAQGDNGGSGSPDAETRMDSRGKHSDHSSEEHVMVKHHVEVSSEQAP